MRIGDAFSDKVLVYALDSGPFRGVGGLLSALISGLFSGLLSGYSAYF